MKGLFAGEASGAAEAEAEAKEWEHTMLQENLDKELQELNKRLEQKEVSTTTPILHIFLACFVLNLCT